MKERYTIHTSRVAGKATIAHRENPKDVVRPTMRETTKLPKQTPLSVMWRVMLDCLANTFVETVKIQM